jgi:isopentenyl-diphosphate Delta-isomerase
MEQVILVDELDNEVGTMDKMEAHQTGELHRAFSVLLFNSKGEILLQKRSRKKYHSGGLWTNACCSHPQPNESMADATARKLFQEMGIAPRLRFAFKFIYQIRLEGNLIEHEYDHVFTGLFDGKPQMNEEEVEDWKFVNLVSLRKDVSENPASYTYWFPLILNHPELAIGIR